MIKKEYLEEHNRIYDYVEIDEAQLGSLSLRMNPDLLEKLKDVLGPTCSPEYLFERFCEFDPEFYKEYVFEVCGWVSETFPTTEEVFDDIVNMVSWRIAAEYYTDEKYLRYLDLLPKMKKACVKAALPARKTRELIQNYFRMSCEYFLEQQRKFGW